VVTIAAKIVKSVVEFSHQLISQAVHAGSVAVDATAGNGYDTLFLAQSVGASGKVFAFDIQEKAIAHTQRLLKAHGLENRVELICQGHEKIDEYVPAKVHGIIFNLGYLPGGDQGVVTNPDTTVTALEKSIHLLTAGGVLAIAVYWGHPGGPEEKQAVENWVQKLSPRVFDVIKIDFPNKNKAPFLFGVQKKLLEE